MQCFDLPLIQKGISHLKANDKVLSDIIDGIGSFELRLRLPLFRGLVRTIISQQLGEPAAWTLYTRFLRLYQNRRPLAILVNGTQLSDITQLGISTAKAILIKKLACLILPKEKFKRQMDSLRLQPRGLWIH